MGTLDVSTAVDRVRLAIADYMDPEILSDDTITWILTSNNNNELAATKVAAGFILGALSRDAHSRLDKLEFYGSEVFENYLKYLKYVINNPASGAMVVKIYAAGINQAEVDANDKDTSIVHNPIPSYANNDYPWQAILKF